MSAIRNLALTSVAVAAITSPAYAQTASPAARAEARDLDQTELVVTAQKREERLLDVPVPVTSLTAETLAEQNLVKLADYATRVPGLRTTGNRAGQVSIRGVGELGASPTVAVTIDDVPFGATSWAGFTPFPELDPSDLSRIEVLRGPQGTLYGASSLGGLIKLVTKDPNPNDASGRVEIGKSTIAGGDDGYVLRGSLNIPLIKDMLALRVSGFRRADAPYIDNIIVESDPRRGGTKVGLLNAEDANKDVFKGNRVALLFRPIDDLTINLSRLEQTRDSYNGGTTEVNSATDLTPRFGYFKTLNGPIEVFAKQRLNQARIVWDAPFGTLTSVSGWGKATNRSDRDRTASWSFIFSDILPDAPAGSTTKQLSSWSTKKFTQEVRLASNGGGPLEWLVGAFYTHEDTDYLQTIPAYGPDGTLLAVVAEFPAPSTFREKAVFADATYHFTDRFDLQVGARYSKNKQSYSEDQTVLNPVAADYFGPTTRNGVGYSSEGAFTWLIAPRYNVSDDLMLYGRASSGYRPGGPNTPAAPNRTYASDTVVNYEIGAKGYALNRRLTFDVSLFDIEWDQIQLTASTPGGSAFFLNGGKARSYGFEGATQFSPGDGWKFNLNATIGDTSIRGALPPNPAGPDEPYLLGKKGDRIPYQTRLTGNLGVEKTWDVVDDYRGTLGVNVSYVGKRAMDFRSTSYPAARQQQRLYAPAYAQVDLYARVSNNVWDFSAFIRNLGSTRGVLTVADSPFNAIVNAEFVAPQSMGISIARSF